MSRVSEAKVIQNRFVQGQKLSLEKTTADFWGVRQKRNVRIPKT